MTLWRLALNSLRFHWRSNVGVLLGATVSAAILIGALAVGDSVRYSLKRMALARLGNVHLALNSQTRFFRAELADALTSQLNAPAAPVILLSGTASGRPRGAQDDNRVGRVQVVGVDERFWQLGGAKTPGTAAPDSMIVSDRLAAKLGVQVGDEVLLRVDKPSLLSRDAPLSTVEDATVPLRLPVGAIVGDAEFARFSLEANQIPPMNAFVPLQKLQQTVGMEARANGLLVGARQDGSAPTPAEATSALWGRWQFDDSGLELKENLKQGALELRTTRVFLDPPVGEAALKASPNAQGILTYFVNELRLGDRSTPYSTVAALQSPLLPADMEPGETLINRWLADDLQAKVGDEIKLTFWLVGPMRKLIEQSSTFRVRAILPMEGAAADPDLMPDIPGLSDKKNCRDWEPGVPIDLDKIRDRDQAYWTAYRGTPKAFITLAAGQRIWNNRFGNLTAVRFPTAAASRATVETQLRQALSPASMGLFFTPARELALAASSQAMNFGGLFLAFSFFLIVAALLLTMLLFAFGVEQRAEEVGTLLALGLHRKRVQRLLLLEGGALALVASLLGAACAVFYTQAVVRGLSTIWRGAVANSALVYHAEPTTLIGGAVAAFLVAALAIWLVTRAQAKAPARELLAAGTESETRLMAFPAKAGRNRLPGLATALIGILGALLLIGLAATSSSEHAAERFFGAGALLLIGAIALCRLAMAWIEQGAGARSLTVGSLAARNSARRRARSLTAIGLLACGSFLVIAVGANRHDPSEGAERRASGTGGFQLYGETTLPVYRDLNTEEGREAFGLEAEALLGVSVVPMRLRKGDEASCLNLNRAQAPNLLGVPPEALRQRGAFTFTRTLDKASEKDPWRLLERPGTNGEIPAIGDVNTVVWSLGKSVGDTLPYVDERGQTFRIKIVGMIANSVLQGSLILSEENFIQRFPSQSGYQVFLLDTPAGGAATVTKTLTKALEDVGFDLMPTAERLAAFNTVENTYLSIFALLGGLGLLLGSVGLGVVVLRNVLERRGELALLRAVGFGTGTLHRLVFSEHLLLLALGLLAGVLSALIAVLPALRAPGADVPILSLALTLLAVLLSGFVWTWGATTLALRGPLLKALRNE